MDRESRHGEVGTIGEVASEVHWRPGVPLRDPAAQQVSLGGHTIKSFGSIDTRLIGAKS